MARSLVSRFVPVLFCLGLLVGLAAPARAELTSAERASVQWIIWAAYGSRSGDAGSLHDGTAAVLDLIVRDYTRDTTRDQIRQLKNLVRQTQNEIGLAVADLLGARTAPLDQPRSFYVDRAKGRIANVRANLIPAISAAADAVKAAGAAGAYPATIDRFKSINLAGAAAKLALFNATLEYADPYPLGRNKVCDPVTGVCVPGNRITIIGPHGDYIKAQTWLTTALDRLNRMYMANLDAYGADTLLPSYNNTYQRFKFISLVINKVAVTMGTISGMQFSGYSSDVFFRTLAIMENMSHGGGGPVTVANDCSPDFCHAMSYDFNNLMLWAMGDWWQTAGRPAFTEALRRFLSEITEAWQATDSALWYMLKFPECDRTGGCGGTGS